jgi:hypothetical protein
VTAARRRALLALAVAIAVAAGGFALWISRGPAAPPPRDAAHRPVLLLLTSLPLIFGEDFSLEGAGSPALSALETRYTVVPISVASPAELAKGHLLLMAQPLAQPAEDLVALDAWVRRGGRLLLLADPMLEWPSEKPLGDLTRPPAMFADTGLLAHWGVRLDAPAQRGPRQAKIAGFDMLAMSPGSLSGSCPASSEGLAAHCRIGRGEAIVIADADLLDTSALGSAGSRNLDALLALLARLEQERKPSR